MNQKNYKAIAEIIRKCRLRGNVIYFESNIIQDLADYFERESFKYFDRLSKEPIIKTEFSRKQFLKDCGVN